MSTYGKLAQIIADDHAKIILIYGFNATGKTRLSIAYKNVTKREDGSHTGIYYNAFSEDLFVWDNDHENHEENISLIIKPSSLNQFHATISEDSIRDILKPYRPNFDFLFKINDDPEKGIDAITFFQSNNIGDDAKQNIKISRGEERLFVWCFFMALLRVEGWAGRQSEHFFIDDPVSSLDDNNIFVTASSLFNLIEEFHANRKFIITTHHMGFFAILADRLTKGETKDKFKDNVKLYILKLNSNGDPSLERTKSEVFLYHLRILQVLKEARDTDNVFAYHFALLRQVLENISSFLGVSQFSYVLQQIAIDDREDVATIVNSLSHRKVYYPESDQLPADARRLFDQILDRILRTYNFVLH